MHLFIMHFISTYIFFNIKNVLYLLYFIEIIFVAIPCDLLKFLWVVQKKQSIGKALGLLLTTLLKLGHG